MRSMRRYMRVLAHGQTHDACLRLGHGSLMMRACCLLPAAAETQCVLPLWPA